MLLPHHYIHTILHIRRRIFENHTPNTLFRVCPRHQSQIETPHPHIFYPAACTGTICSRPPVNGTLTRKPYTVYISPHRNSTLWYLFGRGWCFLLYFSPPLFRAMHPDHALQRHNQTEGGEPQALREASQKGYRQGQRVQQSCPGPDPCIYKGPPRG